MSKMMNEALSKSVAKKDVLFPFEAMDILKSVYGKRLDIMRPKTIANKVESLCYKNGYEPDNNDIINAVNEFIFSA